MAAHDGKARLAAGISANRQQRQKYLPQELFGETPWDMLLMLFVADANGKRVDGNKMVEQLGCSPRALSRWLKHLSAIGLIVGDGTGDLSDDVTMSPTAFEAVEKYLDDTQALAQDFAVTGDFDKNPGRGPTSDSNEQ
jgi:hypothetical protein